MAPLYTMVRDHKHGKLRALKTYPKVSVLWKFRNGFMHERGLSSVM